MINLTATQQLNGGWYLHNGEKCEGYRGKTIDECLTRIPAMDGARVQVNIGYLKKSELKKSLGTEQLKNTQQR